MSLVINELRYVNEVRNNLSKISMSLDITMSLVYMLRISMSLVYQ